MRQFPRPGRLLQRLGNVLPDASGEIIVPRPRAAADRRSAPGHEVEQRVERTDRLDF